MLLFTMPATLPLGSGVPSVLGAVTGERPPTLVAHSRPGVPVSPASLPARHRVQVLRQISGASGLVTSGQAVCNTCHWEGPRRAGGSTGLLEADAAGHARTTTGRWSGDFIGG